MKPAFVVTALLGVAGCTNHMEITSAPVDVSRTSEFVATNYVGDHPTTVRSYFVGEDEKGREERIEFSGAKCQVKGRGFRAKFSTPAVVNLPDHGFHSQAVTGSCTTGKDVRPIVARPYNITVANMRNNSGAGGGVAGVLVASIATSIALAANDPTNDDFGYLSVGVEFPKQ